MTMIKLGRHFMQVMQRVTVSVDQRQEESKVCSCYGLEGADKPCHWLQILRYWRDWDQQKEAKQPQVSWSWISTSSCSYTLMKLQYLFLDNFLTWRFLQCSRRWTSGSQRWYSSSVFPKRAKWASSRFQPVKVIYRAICIETEGIKPPLWQCSHDILPKQTSRAQFVLWYCSDSAQAWRATLWNQRLETVD